MDVKALADKGEVFTSDKDKNILQSIDFLDLVQTDVKTISIEKSLENLIEYLSSSNQSIIPVLDEKNKMLGIIDFESIRPIVFNQYRVKFTMIKEIISQPKVLRLLYNVMLLQIVIRFKHFLEIRLML